MSEESLKHTELLASYERVIQDIRFTKNQIWNTLYLTILAIAGLISIAFFLYNKEVFNVCFKYSLVVMLTFISFFGFIAIYFHQKSLAYFREMKQFLHSKLIEDGQLEEFIKKDMNNTLLRDNVKFFNFMFPAIIILTFLFSLLLFILL